jgi:DUF4097 and DUF4098 domain-containing protein YvlB
MSRNIFRLAVASAFISLVGVTTICAQDFQRTYQVGAGGSVSIHNVSGNVKVTGYDGNAIIVTGIKTGRDRELVDVDDRSGAGKVDVRVRYPEQCNCEASINFEVQVPRAVKYQFDNLSSASGDISVNGVLGDVKAKSASGDVSVADVTGAVDASTASGDVSIKNIIGSASGKSASGDVEAEITRLDGGGNMEFASTSGNVKVKMPADLGAVVNMSVLSGSLHSDFPLEIQERERGYGRGRSAQGRVGDGTRTLRLSSISGNVSLNRS